MRPRVKTLTICIGILLCLIFASKATFLEENFKSKYEYKYSFKGPNLAQTDKGIPFWNHSFGENYLYIHILFFWFFCF